MTQLKCHNYYRYFLCELSQESGHIGEMDQTKWKRWNSEVNELIIISLLHHRWDVCHCRLIHLTVGYSYVTQLNFRKRGHFTQDKFLRYARLN